METAILFPDCKPYICKGLVKGPNKPLNLTTSDVLTIRHGYSVSKRLVKLTMFQGFPWQLPGYQDLPPLSFMLSYQL